jgi:hypothetical protein
VIFGIYYSIGKIGADLAESVDFIGLGRICRSLAPSIAA